jgi:magnesium/cobalt transport protein CorA
VTIRAVLYDANGHDRIVDLSADVPDLDEQQLLWIDVDQREPDELATAARALGLEPETVRRLATEDRRSELFRLPNRIVLRLGAVEPNDPDARRHELAMVVGRNHVMTVHDGPLGAIEEFRSGVQRERELGRLEAAAFAVSIIDAVLTIYFRSVEAIERDIDALDELAVRTSSEETFLGTVLLLRRRIARLRRTLVPNREALAPLGRPDFELRSDIGSVWPGVLDRLERAIDGVENSRELLVGSFDLYLGRSSQRTNDVMKVLTLVSSILLPGAVLAGIMGMNFPMGFFQDQNLFWAVLGGMATMAVVILGIARWRNWI